jgi:hypothetical protein
MTHLPLTNALREKFNSEISSISLNINDNIDIEKNFSHLFEIINSLKSINNLPETNTDFIKIFQLDFKKLNANFTSENLISFNSSVKLYLSLIYNP